MSLQIICAEALEGLRSLPDASVHCVVTSPPYWGLRDYGTTDWVGGDPECKHYGRTGGTESSGLAGHANGLAPETIAWQTERSFIPYRTQCGRCGAVRVDDQLGLERTPGEYVTRLVEIFGEVWRVLRDDGTCWLNLGDSWANDWKWGGITGGKHAKGLHGSQVGRARRQTGLKAKDLVGIPWRVALALQEDGWYLRQDIIWRKPNPMPESMLDRCTKSHEHLFLLAKSGKPRWWRNIITGEWRDKPQRDVCYVRKAPRAPKDHGHVEIGFGPKEEGSYGLDWSDVRGSKGEELDSAGDWHGQGSRGDIGRVEEELDWSDVQLANPKSKEYKRVSQWRGFDYWFDAAAIAEQASQSERERWMRSTRTEPYEISRNSHEIGQPPIGQEGCAVSATARKALALKGTRNRRDVWDIATVPYTDAHFATFPETLPKLCIMAGCMPGGVVLDPFAGSGTTGKVARDLGRSAVLIELNPKYIPLIRKRCDSTPGFEFSEVIAV